MYIVFGSKKNVYKSVPMKGIEIKIFSIALILWIFASVVAYLLIDLLI